jgi:hypothetical protein
MFDGTVIADLSDEEAPPAPPPFHRRVSRTHSCGWMAASETFTDERAFVVLNFCLSYEW